MSHCNHSKTKESTHALIHDLGTFEGFNFRHHLIAPLSATSPPRKLWTGTITGKDKPSSGRPEIIPAWRSSLATNKQ